MLVICGDCLEVLKTFDSNSVDSIVTDPPAGIAFMGKEWDKDKGGRDQWIAWMQEVSTECLRVIKPGGHALVWSIPRTSHWTAMAWENAGWEVRDKIVHIFGSGFPKSRNISKDLDLVLPAAPNRKAISSREIISCDKDLLSEWHVKNGLREHQGSIQRSIEGEHTTTDDNPISDAAKQWNGWGTALKPAHEDWLLFRKPVEGTIAQNVLKYGVGGINIDGCRVEFGENDDAYEKGIERAKQPRADIRGGNFHTGTDWSEKKMIVASGMKPTGRFPANLIHDGSDEVLEIFPHSNGAAAPVKRGQDGKSKGIYGDFAQKGDDGASFYGDSGSAARFFYCAKASPSERNAGCENLPDHTAGECTDRKEGSAGLNSPRAGAGRTNGAKNNHPTVKALALCRYLVKLITPPEGIVLDPFCGSGSIGVAALEEGFDCILIDNDPNSVEISKARLRWVGENNTHNHPNFPKGV